MGYKNIGVRLLFFLLFPFTLFGQFTYRLDQGIPVEVNGTELPNPWAGGLNSPQVNRMDLNGDGLEDLVIFDKTTALIRTFLWTNNTYLYTPEYEALFPDDLSTFVALRDFNCDGKKDIFTFGQIGVWVYQQVSVPGKPFGWKKLSFYNSTSGLFSEVLLSKGFSSKINLLPGSNDYPDFADMDGDGDLDVLNMRFVSPSTAEYHKNFSMERYGTCDSLDLERQASNWGGFTECNCGKIAFDPQTCADIGGRTNHNAGKALLAIDLDGDNDKDLLFTEESCTTLYSMENLGTTESPVLNNLAPFPAGLAMNYYPSPYLEDVDHDGVKDLLIGLNLNVRIDAYTDFSSSLFFYKNTGTNALPNFEYQQANFLQDQMIDLSDESAPALADLDLDGDLDLVVGNFLNPINTRGSLTLYQNIGTPTVPRFKWVTDNFANISFTSLYSIRPQFADVDANGSMDMVFTAIAGGINRLWYILSAGGTIQFTGQNLFFLPVALGPGENATMVDVDLDGQLDVVVGKSTGALYYYRNTGSVSTPSFSLANDAFLGLGTGTFRQNLSASAADLDGDGHEDLIVGGQDGKLMIFSDFRSSNPVLETNLVFDAFGSLYTDKNMGGSARTAVGNLFGFNRPSVIVGNRLGGLQVLINEDASPQGDSPNVKLFPNPVVEGNSLTLVADRNVTMEIFTVLGTRLGQPQVLAGNQVINFPLKGITAGVYIARFTAASRSVVIRFVVL